MNKSNSISDERLHLHSLYYPSKDLDGLFEAASKYLKELENYKKQEEDGLLLKLAWHKITDDTWKVIPRDIMLLFVIQYEDVNTREIIKQVIPGSIDSESNCLHLHCASSKNTPNNRNTEDIVAWTELPEYKEREI